MSRSYKHVWGWVGGGGRFVKKTAQRKVRHCKDVKSGGEYRRVSGAMIWWYKERWLFFTMRGLEHYLEWMNEYRRLYGGVVWETKLWRFRMK